MCKIKRTKRRKHLPVSSANQQSAVSEVELSDIFSNEPDFDLNFPAEIIYCRSNDNQLTTVTAELNGVVKGIQNSLSKKQDENRKDIHFEIDTIPRNTKDSCNIDHDLVKTILGNVSTIICMAYQVILNDNKLKQAFKSSEKPEFLPRKTIDNDVQNGKYSYIQYLFESNICFRQKFIVCPVSLNNYFDSFTTSGSSMSLDESMSNNLLRIYSFNSFPRQVNIFTSQLAKAGFYYTGISDEVRCYACSLSYKNWSSEDKPLEIHSRLSPSCSHVIRLNLEQENIESDLYRNSGSNTSNNRNTGISSLLSVPTTDSTSHLNNLSNPKSSITSQNFPSLSDNRSISSSPCLNVLTSMNGSTHNILNKQLPNDYVNETNASAAGRSAKAQYPNQLQDKSTETSYANYKNHDSSETSATLNSSIEVNNEEAKYPNYGPIQIRISSFQGWPSYLDQTPHIMAKAGFLYAGYQDYTRCFFCGGGLRNWEAGDDPWIEHARWFPNCRYLRENKGDRFVKAVQDKQAKLNKENSQTNGQFTPFQISSTSVNNEASGTKSQDNHQTKPHLETIAAKSVLEMGYKESQVRESVQKITQAPNGNGGDSNISAVDILSQLLDDDDVDTQGRQSSLPGNTSLSGTAGGEICTDDKRTISKNESYETFKCQSVNGTSLGANGNSPTVNGAFMSTSENSDATVGVDDSTIDDTEQLAEENRQLKDQRLCKICLDYDASIAFLPCGHLVCCSDCAPAMRKCPICRAFVRGTVKTFLV